MPRPDGKGKVCQISSGSIKGGEFLALIPFGGLWEASDSTSGTTRFRRPRGVVRESALFDRLTSLLHGQGAQASRSAKESSMVA